MILLLEHFNLEVNEKVYLEETAQSKEIIFNKQLAGTTTTRNMQHFTV